MSDGDTDDDVFDEFDEQIPEEGDPFEALAETEEFTAVDAGDIDEDAVWERLVEGATEPAPGPDEETVVPKASYCEQCEYFAPPPEVRCTHEGTEILELVDMEHVRVVACPVVAQRRGMDDVERE